MKARCNSTKVFKAASNAIKSLFAGSDRGADRAAAIATLIMTAKFNDVDAANIGYSDSGRLIMHVLRSTTSR